ncbi:MAG: formate dehydrogenase accessory sulfurtransferase FdhD [Saprospiraceae bacterium]|nr:formate dehydrogenase accessory sulfurtransferase FdhD [Saprospiraceae bacterium]
MAGKSADGLRNIEAIEVTGQDKISKQEIIVAEEPLEIRLRFYSKESPISSKIAVTMRTPGYDAELATGFLFTEGIITEPNAIETVEHVPARNVLSEGNLIEVGIKKGIPVDLKKLQRNFYTSSSCGVCGKASIEAVKTSSAYPILHNTITVKGDIFYHLPDQLRNHQELFDCTGGLHAAGLFDLNGNLIVLREDIGRHNAVDKAIGYALKNLPLPLSETILLVSGRAGFEIVQKASMAGIPILAAVGAPSSLSYKLAMDAGMTLIGFLKGDRFNVYTFPGRIG